MKVPLHSRLRTFEDAMLQAVTPDAGVTYHFRVSGTDAAGNRAESGDHTFRTPKGPAWRTQDQ